MRPKSYASSTTGVKKSTVATIARSGVNWYTAASSRVEASTRMRGSERVGTWRKTCANSAGPSLQAQPAPCDSAVRRMAFMSPADMGSTEDTLSESPSENGARDHIPEDVANRADHRLAPLPCAPRQARHRHHEAEQQEQEPPTAVSERIEPQRGHERHDGRLDRPPQQIPLRERPHLPDDLRVVRRCRAVERGEPQADAAHDRELHRHGQPREHEAAEAHRRSCGGRYPGPRSPRPGRAAVSLPWSSTF